MAACVLKDHRGYFGQLEHIGKQRQRLFEEQVEESMRTRVETRGLSEDLEIYSSHAYR